MAIGDTVQAGLMRFDSSAYERAGQANAQANAAFGNALSMAAKGFYEGQEKKARAKEIEEDLIRNGEDPAAAKAISKNPFLQKEHQRREATKATMQMEGNRLAMQARSIANQARDASEKNLLAKEKFGLDKEIQERAIADRKTLEKFSEDLLSETADPAVISQVEEVRPGMFALGNETQRNRFLDFQQEQQPKVAVGQLGSSDFAQVAREREFDPTLAGQRFMSLQKAEVAQEEEDLAELGDQFSSRLGAISPYYFSESDAINDISQQASKINIDLNKDQIDLALKKQRIVDAKELRAESLRQIKATKIDEAADILQAGEDLEKFLADGSPLSATIAKDKLARMVQPEGILTEDDLNRVGGSKGFRDRIKRGIQEVMDGTADAKTKEDLQKAANIFKASAIDKINVEHPQIIKYLSETFEITPQDAAKRTALDRYTNYMSKVSQPGQSVLPTSPPAPAISTSTLPSGGRFTPAQ